MFRLIGKMFRFTVKMGLLAVGIGLIIGYANLSDLEGWKKDMQERLSTVSGRQLSIDGPIDFEVSFPPRIIANGVRIQNAPWGSRPDMLTAKQLIAEVDFLPLLFGEVAVPRVQLVGVDILVETKGSGEGNWDDLNDFQTSAGGPVGGPGFPVFGLGGVGVAGGTVTIANLATGAVNILTLPGILVNGVGGIPGLPCL